MSCKIFPRKLWVKSFGFYFFVRSLRNGQHLLKSFVMCGNKIFCFNPSNKLPAFVDECTPVAVRAKTTSRYEHQKSLSIFGLVYIYKLQRLHTQSQIITNWDSFSSSVMGVLSFWSDIFSRFLSIY
jgi:hypothetical protein